MNNMSTDGHRILNNHDLSIALTNNGDVRSISKGAVQISQYVPQDGDPGMAGLWLRRRIGDRIGAVIPLIGASARASFTLKNGNEACWCGSDKDSGISWTVILLLSSPNEWSWTVRIHADAPGEWDLVTAQDVALAPRDQALTSEPYISQYIAYRTADDRRHGVVLAARQTMTSAPVLPLLVTAMTPSARAVMTDGFDFYGREARSGRQARALDDADWVSGGIRQYEFGMMCLLSNPQTAERGDEYLSWRQSFLFKGDDRGSIPEACLRYARELPPAVDVMKVVEDDGLSSPVRGHSPLTLINGRMLGNEELLALSHGSARDIERDKDGNVLSFFMNDAAHLVSARKEMLVDRSHGQILLAGVMDANGEPRVARPVLATTAWMPGIFGSQTVMGNSNLHTLVSVHRDSLNLLRMNGTRIIVEDKSGPRMLGIPSAFVMELGRVSWIYQLGSEKIDVSLAADVRSPMLALTISSTKEVRATVVMNLTTGWKKTVDGHHIRCVPTKPLVASSCPQLIYDVSSTSLIPKEDGGSECIMFRGDIHQGTIILTASEEGRQSTDRLVRQAYRTTDTSGSESREQEYVSAFTVFDRDFHVEGTRLADFDLIVPWLTQNALVHLLSPHGLEQYSGAAWGTRDVLQGPVELCLALGHPDIVRRILLCVFSRQAEDGSLPQWFMFDQYSSLFQQSSHDDIPIWPLLAIAEYSQESGDIDIFRERVPFRSASPEGRSDEATVMDHLMASLHYIDRHHVPGTPIYSYGEGDWDDTLQPAKSEMKSTMASTWTVALLYQACSALGSLLSRTGYADQGRLFLESASRIRDYFSNQFLFDDILAGYVSFGPNGPKPIIHPLDRATGMKYRLIPMTRAIISGILGINDSRHQMDIIQKHLHYPDGVRLMDRPAQFHDGIPRIFKRAEQSSFVGREVGLMYTHAHIRYTEALAALGDSSVADELLRVSPIDLFRWLPTAERRQRNCYFASSDADFRTRYEANRQWDRLREGSRNPVGVKGGWRVYSSGPGIYISQLIRHVFGIQIHHDRVVFDPLMRSCDDGTSLIFSLWGKDRRITYHVAPEERSVTVVVGGHPLKGVREALAYRTGGVSISRDQIAEADRIDVYLNPCRNRDIR